MSETVVEQVSEPTDAPGSAEPEDAASVPVAAPVAPETEAPAPEPGPERAQVQAQVEEAVPASGEGTTTTPASEASAPAEPGAAAGEGGATASRRPEENDAAAVFRRARSKRTPLEGRVIGWNKGGFHVLVNGITAFCPRSEMEQGEPGEAAGYLDQDFRFMVLRVEDGGRRIVLSRSAAQRAERGRQARELIAQLQVGAVRKGTVATLTDFGAFVDIGGVRGLVHVSEIGHDPVERPGDVLSVGQEVEVKVIKVQEGGKRISLSIKALAPDPWSGVSTRYPEGTVVKGTIERTTHFGAFVRLEPGLTGLLPTSEMELPREASAARAFPPGKEVTLQVLGTDPRQRRLTLGPEGSRAEGSRADLKAYQKRQHSQTTSGFNALADALKKLR